MVLQFLYHPVLRIFRTYILRFLISPSGKHQFFFGTISTTLLQERCILSDLQHIRRPGKEIKENLKPMESVSHLWKPCLHPGSFPRCKIRWKLCFPQHCPLNLQASFILLYHLHWCLFPLPPFFKKLFSQKFRKECKCLCSYISFCV